MATLRQAVKRSSAARLGALPYRVRNVGRHNAHILVQSAKWLRDSREMTNYTYDLDELNAEYLARVLAHVSKHPVEQMQTYIAEVLDDAELREHIRVSTLASPLRAFADPVAKYGRRVGWYALVRALEPEHVVETGTDKGLGALVMAAALLRNGHGRVTTIDIDDDSGYLIGGPYGSVIDFRRGNSLDILSTLGRVDMFLHDSLHTADHEAAEYDAVAADLADDAIVLSDNAHVTNALASWADRFDKSFLFWQEVPRDHWHPGEGIGIAFPAL